jgi:hypothetical protein
MSQCIPSTTIIKKEKKTSYQGERKKVESLLSTASGTVLETIKELKKKSQLIQEWFETWKYHKHTTYNVSEKISIYIQLIVQIYLT